MRSRGQVRLERYDSERAAWQGTQEIALQSMKGPVMGQTYIGDWRSSRRKLKKHLNVGAINSNGEAKDVEELADNHWRWRDQLSCEGSRGDCHEEQRRKRELGGAQMDSFMRTFNGDANSIEKLLGAKPNDERANGRSNFLKKRVQCEHVVRRQEEGNRERTHHEANRETLVWRSIRWGEYIPKVEPMKQNPSDGGAIDSERRDQEFPRSPQRTSQWKVWMN